MIGYLQQVSTEQLNSLIARVDELGGVIIHEPFDEEVLDIDKAWHGIHYLLNGNSFGGEEPYMNVILGGTPIGADEGYGPARFLTAEQVKEVSNALLQLDSVKLELRYNAAELSAESIYPSSSEWNEEEDKEYLLSYYSEVVDYYRLAASKGNGMLLYLL
ncbi:YfbM family protein [Paenibacillus sinopodophylli]|uniref:YfbM family protein n=1 Tax=Paenibacillus sinopodophylli TaxID=1837342 RepID=UPI001FEA9D7C|nr:YfbM family protein [Paenibacillus sinopodophylli]